MPDLCKAHVVFNVQLEPLPFGLPLQPSMLLRGPIIRDAWQQPPDLILWHSFKESQIFACPSHVQEPPQTSGLHGTTKPPGPPTTLSPVFRSKDTLRRTRATALYILYIVLFYSFYDVYKNCQCLQEVPACFSGPLGSPIHVWCSTNRAFPHQPVGDQASIQGSSPS